MVKFADDIFEYIAPSVCIGAIVMIPLGPLYLPRFWILFLSAYFVFFLGTQLNHLVKFWMTSQGLKRTIIEHNRKLNAEKDVEANNYVAAKDSDLKNMESSLVDTFDENYFVHAIVVPNYAEPEALIRDTIGRVAIHK
jgi:hypothetical protein